MSKTTIIIIVVAIIAIILLLFLGMKKNEPAANDDIAQLGAILAEPGNPKRDCRRICDTLVQHRPVLFGGRMRAKNKCQTECAQGIDVTTKSY